MVGLSAKPTLLQRPVGRLVVGALPVFVGAFASLAVSTGPTSAFTCMTETLTILLRLRAVFGHVPGPFTIVAHVLLLGAVCRHVPWVTTSVTFGLSDIVSLSGVPFTTRGVIIDLHTPDVTPA